MNLTIGLFDKKFVNLTIGLFDKSFVNLTIGLFDKNFVNLTIGLFDKNFVSLTIGLFDKKFAKGLCKTFTLTVTVKAKPDTIQYKQIPGNMQEKLFKAEKGKIYY